MARIMAYLNGATDKNGSPLLMHNERLADPLDPYSREIAKISGKRKKTEADHLEIARIEFAGGMYFDEELGPCVPTWNVIRCIQDAGRRQKLGVQVIRGITPATALTPVEYDGPRDIQSMWDDGRFTLRKSVGIGQSRTMRTRPVFVDWKVEAELELDLTILDVEKVDQLVEEAGRYVGLGDNRPLYGRFFGSAKLVSAKTTHKAKATSDA